MHWGGTRGSSDLRECEYLEVRIKKEELRTGILEPAKSFRDLILWQKAHEFVLSIYSYTSDFPKNEIYGLTSQFRRAAVSVAANIAEGFIKRTPPDKLRFLNIAQGSLEECRYYIVLSRDLKFGDNGHLENQAEEVSKILNSYMKAINFTQRK